jgi:cell division protein FtsL
MIRLATVLWLVLVAFVGFGMFKVKYEVMDLEDELARANRAIVADQDAIHVLKAEWAFLAQPSRLAELSRRHLDLVPLGTSQLGQIDAIALRPGTVPPTADNGTTAPTPPQIAAATLADVKTRIDR